MKYIALVFLFTLTSCAGYRFAKSENTLFSNEGIESLSIPMFLNKSIYPGVSAPMTAETINVFSSLSGVNVYTGENLEADAILVGVISSPKRKSDAIRTGSILTTGSSLKPSIGNRADFFVPTSSRYKITVRYLLIKKPSQKLLSALTSDKFEKLSAKGLLNPKVVFDKTFSYEGSFNREVAIVGDSDSPGVVNYTKSQMFFRQSIAQLSKSSAKNLKELILNVF